MKSQAVYMGVGGRGGSSKDGEGGPHHLPLSFKGATELSRWIRGQTWRCQPTFCFSSLSSCQAFVSIWESIPGSPTHLCGCGGKASASFIKPQCNLNRMQMKEGPRAWGLAGGRREQRMGRASTQKDSHGMSAWKIRIINDHDNTHPTPRAMLMHSAGTATPDFPSSK